MRMEAPPSRYRVVERGGRLVVLDSQAGRQPPPVEPVFELEPIEDLETPIDEPAVAATAPPSSFARPATAQSLIAAPPSFLRNVASTICVDGQDADGRLQWTTARWFDAKGPRTLTLSDVGEQHLAVAGLVVLAAAVGAIILAVALGFIGFVILFVTLSTLRQAKPLATAWIDRLATQ